MTSTSPPAPRPSPATAPGRRWPTAVDVLTATAAPPTPTRTNQQTGAPGSATSEDSRLPEWLSGRPRNPHGTPAPTQSPTPRPSTSTAVPASPSQAPATLDELTARAAAATEAQRQQIAQVATRQLQDLADQLQTQVTAHVNDFDKQCSAELRSTRTSIETELAALTQSTRSTRRRVRRAMIWPPITALLAAALILTWAAWIGHARVSGLPTTVITKGGRTMQVLTGKEWTTCNLAGRPQPCRRIDQPNKKK